MSLLAEALRSLFAHPLRSILTASSVAFGAAALYVLLSYATGMPETTASLLRSMGSKEFLVEAGRTRGSGGGGSRRGRSIRIRYADMETIRAACPSIAGMAPAYSPGRGGPAFSSNRSWPWTRIQGVGYEYQQVTDMRIVSGRWFTKEEEFAAQDRALISLPLKEGLFETGSAIGDAIDVSGRRFEIIGVFESNASFAYSIFVPYTTAMEMGETGGRYVSQLAFAPHRPDLAEDAVIEIRRALGALYSFDPYDERALEITENTAFVQRVEATSLALQGLVFTIGVLALVLGCLGAANVVGIAVSERISEIGLKRALGAKAARIRIEVLIENLILSLGGGGMGILLGALAAQLLGPLEFADQARLVPRADLSLLSMAFPVLVLSAVLAGLPAANRAARVDPVEALRAG